AGTQIYRCIPAAAPPVRPRGRSRACRALPARKSPNATGSRSGHQGQPRRYEGCLFRGMGTYASNTKPDQLTLADGPDMTAPAKKSWPSPGAPAGPELVFDTPPPMQAPVAPAPPVPQMGSTSMGETHDPFMAEALREFEAGQVEQPLWVRSLAQSGGNVAAA